MPALKFRVLLDSEKQEEVFRDILINDDDNFESFYNTIISSFQFKGGQMASFYQSNEDWDKGHEVALMDMTFGDEEPEEKSSVMAKTLIRELIESPTQKVILVHDFMSMWIFLIELQGIENTPVSFPQTILEVGNAPDENSRGGNIDDLEMQFTTDTKDADDYLDGFDDYGDLDDEYTPEKFDNIDDLDI